MKRMKVFIIAIISILLIVTFGRISIADEPTVKKIIDENGSVFITFDELKHDYENVLCVSKGVAVKHQKHDDDEQVEYIIQGSAEIDGNDIILTKYNWADNYTKITGTVTERFVTENGEGNILATILTTANFSNGYSGGYVYETDDNGNEVPVEESARYGPKQLCTWGFWNTWTASLPASGANTGVNWQSLFTPEGNKNNADQWSTSEANLTYKCDKEKGGCGKFAYINYAERPNYFSTLPDNWVCPECGKSKDVFTRVTQRELFEIDMKEIKTLAAAHTYRVKVNFVQHVCEDNNLRQKTAQSLIVYEKQPAQIEIVIEKEWNEENASLINNRPQKITALVETYQCLNNGKAENRIHIEGEDKIVELTEDINWKSRLRLKAGADQLGTDNGYIQSHNRRYRVKEVFEIKEGQEYQLNKKRYPGCTTADITFENIKDKDGVVVEKKVKIKGNEEFTIKKEAYTFPCVEIIDEILYVEGRHVVESAYVDGMEVADIIHVNGYKLALDENGKYTEPATEEEIANRQDSVITNKLYAVVKEKCSYVGDTSYIYEDGKMIRVPKSQSEYGVEDSIVGTEAYDEYVEANFDNDPEIEMTTHNAYVRFTNKLEVVNIPVRKIWSPTIEDLIEKGFPEPKSVTIQLLANGKVVEGKTITLNKSNDWTGTFGNLKKYDNEMKEIKYTVQEGEIIYETDKKQDLYFDSKISYDTQTGYTILNKLELIDIKVDKEWKNCSEDKKKEVTVQLLANGKIVEGKTITLNASNNWEGTFNDLVKYDSSGNEIKYTIQEIEIEGFASEITGDIATGFIITNTYFDGYYEINGKVWYDGELGKSSTGNGILDDADIGMEGIKVTLMYGEEPFYEENKVALSVATTDENGEYTIKVNYDNREKLENGESNLYKLYEKASEVERKLSDGNAWVKFEYDGMAYTTIKAHDFYYNSGEFLPSNTSKAAEDINKRASIDGNDPNEPDALGYSTVYSGTPEIKFENESGIPSIQYPEQDPNGYWKNTTVFASTKGFIGSFIEKDPDGVKTYKSDLVNDEKSTEIIKYCKGDTDNNGLENYIYTDAKQNLTTVGNGEHDCTNCNKTGHIMKQHEVKVTKINGVNLGLAAREKQDVKLDSTVTNVDITMQGLTQSYEYDPMRPTIDINSEDMYEKADKYVRRLNTANVILAYQAKQNSESSEELISAYVTYSIAVGNQSATLRLGVDSIINDFDSRYEIDKVEVVTLNDAGKIDPNVQINKLKPDQIKISDVVTENGEITHKRALLSGLGIEAEAECNSKQVILIRYKVNYEAILEVLLDKTVLLNNAVEVDSYRSEYSEETLYYADDHLNEQYAVRGKNYAGYDKDSHPGNAQIVLNANGMLESKNLIEIPDPESESKTRWVPEDDTDIAPQFNLILDDPRTISGTVWEDTDIKTGTNSEAGTYRLGNGIKDSAERNLANVKVELINAVGENANQVAKVYKYSIDENNEIQIIETPAVVYTDKYGNYSFKNLNGDDGYSIPTGVDSKYYVRFTYGNVEKTTSAVDRPNEATDDGAITNDVSNGIRNARNFKSTIISNGSNAILYNYFKNGVGNDMWYMDIPDNASVAVDDISTRSGIDQDLVYGNFNQENSMFAISKTFIMPIEWTRDSQIDVESDEKLPCESTVFDFGIIERAREDLYVSKTITDMEVILADGRALAGGDPSNKDQLNFVKAQRLSNYKVRDRITALSTLPRTAMLEMDSEITQGATVNLKYAITVTNNSEIDIDYDKQHSNGYKGIDYYYYGEIPADDTTLNEVMMASSVTELITYVNKDLEPNVNAEDWTKVEGEEFNALRGDESDPSKSIYISENTFKAIKAADNGYYVYKTTKFADVKPGEEKTLESIRMPDDTMRDSMTASKRLTYKEDNAYDIHSEILVINGKVARTIDSVKEDGKQIPKTYKSGNLVPSLEGRKVQNTNGYIEINGMVPVLSQDYERAGGHEQDDDSVKVSVTQPTGITKYITTYVIATLIGLIVIVIGIVFIKKKVLTK